MQGQRLDATVLEADLPGISGFAVADRARTLNIRSCLFQGTPTPRSFAGIMGILVCRQLVLPVTLAEETLRII